MALIFHRQLQDAFAHRGRWGLLTFYGQTLFDLARTIAAEHCSTHKGGTLMLRRGLDVAASLLMLWLGIPFLLPIAVLIKLDSAGPVFYTAQRAGRNGRLFTLLKLRSMTDTAGERRVTRVGKVLRWTRMDEYPQFYNVLRGEMSLFGPRPYYPDTVETSPLLVRPGLMPWFSR
jgi:lipopolysaccharide/colanic/teichoic acid biosynthesis glycosyltransferase